MLDIVSIEKNHVVLSSLFFINRYYKRGILQMLVLISEGGEIV